MPWPISCQGREPPREEADLLRQWIEQHPAASRRWLAFELISMNAIWLQLA